MVHGELAGIFAFEVEEARSPIQRRAEKRLARTDDMAAAQAVVGYGLDPLRGAAPIDSPTFYISIHDPPRGRVQLAERAALAIGAGAHASDELEVEVRLEHFGHPRRGAENRSHCCRRFCRGCRSGCTAVDTS